jgi:hypothetical protein
MKDENKLRHFLLYCKRWYKTKLGCTEALKVIGSHYSGIAIEDMENRDAYCYLQNLLESLDMDVEQGATYKKLFNDYISWFHGSMFLGSFDDWKYQTDDNQLGKIVGFITVIKGSLIPFEMGEIDPELQQKLDDHYESLAVTEEEFLKKKKAVFNKVARKYGFHHSEVDATGMQMDLLIRASGEHFPYRIKIKETT